MKGQLLFIMLLLGLDLMGCTNSNKKDPPMKNPHIEVWLGGSVETLKGHNWPKNAKGVLSDITALDNSCEISLYFPKGGQFTTQAKSVFLRQNKGTITEIVITPLPDLVDFARTISEIEGFAKKLKIDNDPSFKKSLKEWKAIFPPSDSWTSYGCRISLEPNVELRIATKPHVGGDGWFVVMEFSVP